MLLASAMQTTVSQPQRFTMDGQDDGAVFSLPQPGEWSQSSSSSLDENAMQRMEESSRPENTKQATKSGVKKFTEWLTKQAHLWLGGHRCGGAKHGIEEILRRGEAFPGL